MKTIPFTINPMHFRYLNEEVIQNPLIFIEEFCHNFTSIELFRQDLLELFQAACTRKNDNNGRYYSRSSEYVFDHKLCIQLIEALWIFYHQLSEDLILPECHPYHQKSKWKRDLIDIESRLNSPARHFRKLENAEINNIVLFLKDLFNYRDLTEWREVLDDILYYAHAEESLGYGSEMCSELIPIMDYLEKITEAVFLIADLTIPNPKVNDLCLLKNHDDKKAQAVEEHQIPVKAHDHMEAYLKHNLDDDNFTESLIHYLDKYWSPVEEDSSPFNRETIT
jgi:hypothetical protein